MSIESVVLSNHLIHSCPLLLLPSIFPSIRVFSICEAQLYIGMEGLIKSSTFSGYSPSSLGSQGRGFWRANVSGEWVRSSPLLLGCLWSFSVYMDAPWLASAKVATLVWELVLTLRFHLFHLHLLNFCFPITCILRSDTKSIYTEMNVHSKYFVSLCVMSIG